MPRLVAITTYRDLPDGEPDFSFIDKATMFGLRENSTLVITPATQGLRLTIDSATGLVPVGLTVDHKGARALRDFMIRLCDQLADERMPT